VSISNIEHKPIQTTKPMLILVTIELMLKAINVKGKNVSFFYCRKSIVKNTSWMPRKTNSESEVLRGI